MFHGRVALIVAVIASGCGGSTTAPTTITGAALTQYVFSQIQGDVLDTAFRPLAGVRVEIVDGSEAGAFTISDGDGRFSFVGGRYVDGIHFRASKDGYMTTSVSGPLQFPWPSAVASLGIVLDSIAPPARIEPGSYSVTVTADNSCTGIPDDLRTRTYNATVAPSRDHPSTLYIVEVTGPSLAPFGFGMRVAGNDFTFTIDSPIFLEHFAPFHYLEIAGEGGTSVDVSPASTLAFTFTGSFEYCELRSEMGRTRNCYTTPSEEKNAYSQCVSAKDRMILTRR